MQAASDVFTTVNVVGVARAPYNMVTFSIQVEGDGKKLADAKKKLDERVKLVDKCVKALVTAGTLSIEADSEKRLPSTHYGTDYTDTKNPVSKTTCRYPYSFASANVSCADAVMDALSSIDNTGIKPNLAYAVRDLDALSKLAFADAVSKARARFAEECGAIRVSRTRFAISGYTTRYDESQRYRGSSAESAGMRAMAASVDSGESSIKIDPGLAEIKVHVSMSFSRKKTAARATKSSTKKK